VLYSVNNPLCAFLVLPQSLQTPLLLEEDLKEITTTLGIAPSTLNLYYIATLHKQNGLPSITLNQKAPLVLDETRKLGWQYILSNPLYKIDLPLE